MTKHQIEYLEMRIGEIWWMLDRHPDEATETALVNKLRGMEMVIEAMGYHVVYDHETKTRKIIDDAAWQKWVRYA